MNTDQNLPIHIDMIFDDLESKKPQFKLIIEDLLDVSSNLDSLSTQNLQPKHPNLHIVIFEEGDFE
ncbi:MAG: hypothetical protein ACK5RE_07085 [Pseudanabaena sp.]|jgi:hypothetical protein